MLTAIAWISIGLAIACSLVIALDELRRPQQMAIMNVVWPATALYFSVFALWAYFTVGIRKSKAAMQSMDHPSSNQHLGQGSRPSNQHPSPQSHPSSDQHSGQGSGPSAQHPSHRSTPANHPHPLRQKPQAAAPQPSSGHPPKLTLTQVAVATSHCGAGCTLADLSTEFLLGAFSITLFGLTLWASFVYDFLVAWTLGILFQYLSIQPMRHLPPGQAILAAIKADTLSITAFQVGMYAWMALVFFVLFPHPHLTPFDPRFWLMMQIAMILGYATAFPMNRLLIRAGLKEAM